MDESQKELQNIFQGQSAMKEILTDLHRKMDDIISRQERAFNAISAIQVLYFEIMITNPKAWIDLGQGRKMFSTLILTFRAVVLYLLSLNQVVNHKFPEIPSEGKK